MAFRKKADSILKHKPDILVVPECEHPDKLLFSVDTPKPTDTLWFGKNPNKGLAIFSYSNFRFTVLDNHNQDLQKIIPIAVTDGQLDFILFAIWAYNPTDRDGKYIGQVWKALHYYSDLFADTKTILIGDFNSNKIWDKRRRVGNHSDVVKHLEEKGILSVYHVYHKQDQGTEQHPTLYLHRRKYRPYHIDYCFASKDLLDRVSSVEIGDFDEWIKHSDHVPVVVTFDI